MAIKPLLLALITGFSLVNAQERGSMTVFARPGCREDSADFLKHELRFPVESGGDVCTNGRVTLGTGWETNDVGDYRVWYNSNGIGSDCRLAILKGSDRGPQFCGEPQNVILGNNPGACQEGLLPRNYGVAHCCGTRDDCTPIFPPVREASISSASTSHVTEMKRSNPFESKHDRRQDSCNFQGGDTFESRGQVQTISDTIECSEAGGCAFERTDSVARGASHSFGAGLDVATGIALFARIQTTVSFSYDYTFEETTTVSHSWTLSVPENQRGVAIFTPFTECVIGTFSGDCPDGIATGVEGQACIPVEGLPGGQFSFLRVS